MKRIYYYSILVALNVFGIIYFMEWWPAISEPLAPFAEWLQKHDVTIDLITVWGLSVGFALYGMVKVISWWVLRKQVDATMVGITLKRQKLAEAFLSFTMAILYAMTLIAYYAAEPRFGFWDRLLLRAGLFIAMIMASFYGLQFVYWLRREVHSGQQGGAPLTNAED